MHGSITRKLVKTSCFSFYLLCFIFYKMEAQEGRTGSAGEVLRKGVGG
jgi:hypothetical protein